jgi:hypothetical protein
MYQNALANKIVEMLTPLVGAMMANSVITVQTKKLGIDPEKVSAAELPKMAERFASHLKIFVGTEKARQIGESVQKLA